jgi:CheY-like chemotaxis protein
MFTPDKRMIIVVDDDEDDRFIVSQAFEAHGLADEVVMLKSGTELLNVLREAPLPKLILLDLNMPILSGLETLTLIRRQHSAAVLPVVILTTSDMTEDRQKAASSQANDFITKPVTAASYRRIIAQLYQRWLS